MARQLILLTATLLATAGPAVAQYPYPYPPSTTGSPPASPAGPVLSPYLNLLNGPTNNAGVNYYNFVRPQLQLQQQMMYGATGQFSTFEPYGLGSNIDIDPTKALPRTGPPAASFNTYGPYFNSLGTIGRPIAPGALGARATQPVTPNVPRR